LQAEIPVAKKKSYQAIQPFLWMTAIAAAIFFGYLAFLWAATPGPSSVRYREFGISIPVNYEIHGIDVSRYQQSISWKLVKEMKVKNIRLGFVFIKATEGSNLVDPYFKRNWNKAKEAGITRGAYHFFNPRKDGRTQAKSFINAVKIESGDLPPVLDIEKGWNVPKAKIQQEVKAWLDAVEAAYGVKPILYTYVTFYEKYLKGKFDDYPLWIAHYYQPGNPRIGRTWHFWQHSEEGRVNGITSKVDFNVFNGDSADFRELLVP
jgi:lysozyme